MAQSDRRTTGKPQPTRNLFRGPAVLQAVDDGSTQISITQQLSVRAPPIRRHSMRRNMPVSFGDRYFTIMPEIASKLPTDRRTISPKGTGDLGLTDLLLMHPCYDAAFVQTQLHKRAGHSILLKPWPMLSSLHLKMESAPAISESRITYIMELMRHCRVYSTSPLQLCRIASQSGYVRDGNSSASGKTASSTCPGFNRDVRMAYILASKPDGPAACGP